MRRAARIPAAGEGRSGGRGSGRAGRQYVQPACRPAGAPARRGRAGSSAGRQINTRPHARPGVDRFDVHDMRLLDELVRDGSAPISGIAKNLGANESFVYSRMRRLKRRGILKRHTVTVNDEMLGIGVRALVGISRRPERKEEIHASLMAMPEVQFVSEVMGRFDIMVGIVASDHEALHPVLIDKIGRIDGVEGTETFVELQRIDKDASFADMFGAGMLRPSPQAQPKKRRRPGAGKAKGKGGGG